MKYLSHTAVLYFAVGLIDVYYSIVNTLTCYIPTHSLTHSNYYTVVG